MYFRREKLSGKMRCLLLVSGKARQSTEQPRQAPSPCQSRTKSPLSFHCWDHAGCLRTIAISSCVHSHSISAFSHAKRTSHRIGLLYSRRRIRKGVFSLFVDLIECFGCITSQRARLPPLTRIPRLPEFRCAAPPIGTKGFFIRSFARAARAAASLRQK